jgi:hypothetical protein
MDNGMKTLDNYLGPMKKPTKFCDAKSGVKPLLQHIKKALDCLPDDPSYSTEVIGLQGAFAKRKAQTHFNLYKLCTDKYEKHEQLNTSRSFLTEALDKYRLAAQESVRESVSQVQKKRSLHWSLTQYLSLMAVLHGTFNSDAQEKWYAAMYSARIDSQVSPQGSENWVWALASAMELSLIRYAAWPESDDVKDAASIDYQEKAKTDACQIHRYSQSSLAIQLTSSQMQRYCSWWKKIPVEYLADCEKKAPVTKNVNTKLADLATDLLQILNPKTPSCPGGKPDP